MFNDENHREFYSNEDYERVGGRKIDENENTVTVKTSKDAKSSDGEENEEEINPLEFVKSGKIFSKKRKEGLVTSKLGSLIDQKIPIPLLKKQIVQI